MDKEKLIRIAGRYEFWTGISAGLVFAGIILETFYDLYREWGKAKRKELFFVGLFAVLVAIGVLGEWICGLGLADTGRQIRKIDDEEVRSANVRAADAMQHAAEASKKLATTQNELARAELQLKGVQLRQMPRMLDIHKLANSLRGIKKVKVIMFYKPEDSEAAMLAKWIGFGLSEAGWEYTEPLPIPGNVVNSGLKTLRPIYLQSMTSAERISGAGGGSLTFVGNKETFGTASEVGRALLSSLAAGGGASNGYDEGLPPDTIEIIVNQKD